MGALLPTTWAVFLTPCFQPNNSTPSAAVPCAASPDPLCNRLLCFKNTVVIVVLLCFCLKTSAAATTPGFPPHHLTNHSNHVHQRPRRELKLLVCSSHGSKYNSGSRSRPIVAQQHSDDKKYVRKTCSVWYCSTGFFETTQGLFPEVVGWGHCSQNWCPTPWGAWKIF